MSDLYIRIQPRLAGITNRSASYYSPNMARGEPTKTVAQARAGGENRPLSRRRLSPSGGEDV
jgi:hypothetical protein